MEQPIHSGSPGEEPETDAWFETEAHMPWGAVKLQPMDGGSNRACRGVTQGQTGLTPQHPRQWM